jgi:hypothetical protein
MCSADLLVERATPHRVALSPFPQGVLMDPVLVTAAEAAMYTGRPIGTIWRWAHEGRIRTHRKPGGVKKDARYDLWELNPLTPDGPGAPPARPDVAALAAAA